MKIGLISDTHLQVCPDSFLRTIAEIFKDVEYILHAGDITRLCVLDCLETIAPVHAVCGNMDDDPVSNYLPRQRIVSAEDIRIGLIHGWGAPNGLSQRVVNLFRSEPVKVIVFGHSHHPEIREVGPFLIINPGSACDKRYAPYRSVAILEINKEVVSAQIVHVPDD
ncbi:metallophosphoesterase family protein [bacterium]|nr:metallophosphoesterase family protein [candidate division CSSED10-310 bacterium]